MSPIDPTFTHLHRTLGTAVYYLMVPVEDQVDAMASAFLVIDVSPEGARGPTWSHSGVSRLAKDPYAGWT